MISKIGIFVLLISVLHFVSSFPFSAVDRNKCKSRKGNFPKTGSLCRSYYSCNNWIPKEIVCPEDQHFFPARGYCVWPEEYPCLEKPKSKECPLSNGKFLKPGTECKVYYDCCNGVPTQKKCGKGLLFDHIREKCDWPEYVACPEEPKSKECVRRDGKFLKPGTRCRIFYECRNGISTERKCPEDQLFDPNAERCEWPELYTCVEEPKSKECIRPDGKFLRPGTRCKIYYDCRNGKASEKRCPDDSIFDPAAERCEWPEIYTCVEDVSTTRSTSTPGITTSTLVSSTAEKEITGTTSYTISPKTFTPDSGEGSSEESSSSEEENSSEEYDKYSTKSKIKSTPPNISTSSNGGSTELPEDLTTPSTESSSTTENSSRAISSSTVSNNYSKTSSISATTSTSEYDVKTHTYPEVVSEVTTKLPEDLITTSTESSSTTENSSKTVTRTAFTQDGSTISSISATSSTNEQDVKTYTYPEVVTEETHPETTKIDKSKVTASPIMTSDSTDSVTSHIFCPKPNGYFPHPNDRHKFIACVAGNPSIMDCPSNLVYDHKRRSCQYDRKL